MSQLELRCKVILNLFNQLMTTNSRVSKELMVQAFRQKYPQVEKDLDFCFEVLAGKHKLGYTYIVYANSGTASEPYKDYTVRKFYKDALQTLPATDEGIMLASARTRIPAFLNAFGSCSGM